MAAARAEGLASDPEDKLTKGWRAIHGGGDDPTLDARVSLRLRWDKSLGDTLIQVRATDGVVELKGTVHDLAQRRRAVELTESTAGVERVTDALEIPTPEP
jgi:osmotically-inducible protein OsmY